MKLQYCKPETEVDYLVREDFLLYDIQSKPRIDKDLTYEDIDW